MHAQTIVHPLLALRHLREGAVMRSSGKMGRFVYDTLAWHKTRQEKEEVGGGGCKNSRGTKFRRTATPLGFASSFHLFLVLWLGCW